MHSGAGGEKELDSALGRGSRDPASSLGSPFEQWSEEQSLCLCLLIVSSLFSDFESYKSTIFLFPYPPCWINKLSVCFALWSLYCLVFEFFPVSRTLCSCAQMDSSSSPPHPFSFPPPFSVWLLSSVCCFSSLPSFLFAPVCKYYFALVFYIQIQTVVSHSFYLNRFCLILGPGENIFCSFYAWHFGQTFILEQQLWNEWVQKGSQLIVCLLLK